MEMEEMETRRREGITLLAFLSLSLSLFLEGVSRGCFLLFWRESRVPLSSFIHRIAGMNGNRTGGR